MGTPLQQLHCLSHRNITLKKILASAVESGAPADFESSSGLNSVFSYLGLDGLLFQCPWVRPEALIQYINNKGWDSCTSSSPIADIP